MSADLRKLSDPQKELEAAEHIPSHKSQALQRVKRAINGLLVDSKKKSWYNRYPGKRRIKKAYDEPITEMHRGRERTSVSWATDQEMQR